MTGLPPQLSVAMTAPMLVAGTSPTQLTVTLAGMELMTGAVWSLTVMVCTNSLKLPTMSVAR